ncbi:hypothetical protein K8R43_03280 [archaeon]|nr:hypothetical protein [archaeon]
MEHTLSRVIERIKGKTDYRETKIIKKAKISYDGKQYLIRLPTEIARLFEIKQGQYLEFSVDVPYTQEKKEKVAVVTVR